MNNSTGLPSLDRLVGELTKLPGIGEKTAQRLAYFILKVGSNYTKGLQSALAQISENIHTCSECFAYTEQRELCSICADSHRENGAICVVEEAADIFRVENTAHYRGHYHVLGGALSPLEGIQPEDLRIHQLISRVTQHGDIKEIILALDADLEGDTTALYLSKQLAHLGVRITRLAHGIPFGSDIDYIDRRTLGRALDNRVEI